MKHYQEKQEELEKILSGVRKKFPELDGIRITAKYSDEVNVVSVDIQICIMASFEFFNIRQIEILAPSLPFEFYEASEKEKEAIIAHELGHAEQYKKIKDPKKIIRRHKWVKESDKVDRLENFTSSGIAGQRAKRLMKWCTLNEVYADTQVANRGYGEGLLTYLISFDFFDDPVIEYRTKNLKKILKK